MFHQIVHSAVYIRKVSDAVFYERLSDISGLVVDKRICMLVEGGSHYPSIFCELVFTRTYGSIYNGNPEWGEAHLHEGQDPLL